MILTVRQIEDLYKNQTYIHSIKEDDLAGYDFMPNTHRTISAHQQFMEIIDDAGFKVNNIEMKASHPMIMSINEQKLEAGDRAFNNFFKDMKKNEEMKVGFYFNRVKTMVEVEYPNTEYKTAFGYIHNVGEFFGAAMGKYLSICMNLNIFSADLVRKTNLRKASNKEINMKGFAELVENFHETDNRMLANINNLKQVPVSKDFVYKVFYDNWFISSGVAKGNSFFTKDQRFTDALLKEAIYLSEKTEHPYKIGNDGGTMFDLLNIFTEAMQNDKCDADLSRSFEKYSGIYDYFNELAEIEY